jgi:hypothetical protein
MGELSGLLMQSASKRDDDGLSLPRSMRLIDV